MAGESEEQQPLTATGSNGSSARAQAETAHAAVASYGSAAAGAAVAAPRPPDGASNASAAAENGGRDGLGDIYGEEAEVEAGQRELLGPANGTAGSTLKDGSSAAQEYSGKRARAPSTCARRILRILADKIDCACVAN